MINLIGLFNYRSGSSYVFQSIAGLLNRHFNKTTYLGEYFNTLHLDMWYLDNNNDLKYKEHLWKQAEDYTANLANKNFKNEINNIDLNYTIKKNIKNLNFLHKISSSYVLKFCPHHLVGGNISHLNNLHNKTIKVFLKRSDLEDQCLSFLFARETGLWYSNYSNYNYSNFTYNTDLHLGYIKFLIQQEKELDNLSKKFNYDFLLKYEDLTGNPYIDFKKILNLEDTSIPKEEIQTTVKLLTKQEKINKMPNYNAFKNDFDTVVHDL